MKRINRLTFAAIALATTIIAHQPKILAQADAVPIAAAPSPLMSREISIRNVSSSIMAWWIDPAHQVAPLSVAEPPEFVALRKAMELSGAAIPPGNPVVAKLPQGVEVFADKTRNTLRVSGTEVSVRQVEKAVAALDKSMEGPIRLVQIEAQFVRVSTQDAKLLGIDFRPASESAVILAGRFSSSVLVGRVRSDLHLQAALQKLVAQNKAGVIKSPRIITGNKASQRLGGVLSTTSDYTPLFIGVKNAAGKLTPPGSAFGTGTSRLGFSTSVSLATSAAINADDTVTFFAKPSLTAKLHALESQSLQARTVSDTPANSLVLDLLSVSFAATVQDSETIAFSGLFLEPFQPFDSSFNNAPSLSRNVIVLVTTHFGSP